ncbi:hypothetical protein [Crenalkalicoccus roseus]|uniref:hypothetical protein n=1 Tax=Crenalkalicoccus roseus TaxID=1485588 RepID=UPI001081B20F|nr:hypothetical protein [Crenalkalicoccus roseus]
MPGRRAVLHVGPHKTGTTTIQDALHHNAEALAQAGWRYPAIGYSQQAHHALVQALVKAEDGEAERMLAALADEPGDLVLSSENLSRAPLEALQRLAGALRGREVAVVYYQRNFLDLAYSWWQERIKHGRSEELTAFLLDIVAAPGRLHLFAPHAVLGRLAEAFGRESIHVFLYDRIRADPGLVAHFAREVLELDASGWAAQRRQANRSLRPAAAELRRMLNRLGCGTGGGILPEAGTRALREQAVAREAAHLRTVTLGYDMPAFRRMERALLDHWGDCIRTPLPAPEEAFAERTREIRYVDPAIWLLEPALAAAVRAFAAERRPGGG